MAKRGIKIQQIAHIFRLFRCCVFSIRPYNVNKIFEDDNNFNVIINLLYYNYFDCVQICVTSNYLQISSFGRQEHIVQCSKQLGQTNVNSNTQSLCRCCVEAGILVGVCMAHYLRVNISCQRHSRSSSRHTHTHTLTGQTDESMFSVANQFTIILISIDLIDSVSLFKLIYFVCTHFSASVFCVLFCL